LIERTIGKAKDLEPEKPEEELDGMTGEELAEHTRTFLIEGGMSPAVARLPCGGNCTNSNRLRCAVQATPVDPFRENRMPRPSSQP
jgi:hypothetical protein